MYEWKKVTEEIKRGQMNLSGNFLKNMMYVCLMISYLILILQIFLGKYCTVQGFTQRDKR